MIEQSLVISVYQCHQWFNKTLAVVFSTSLLDWVSIDVIPEMMS